MKNKKGFSLVELIIAIVIVGILSVVSIPVYRNYVKKSMESEGMTMLAEISAAEDIYYTKNKSYTTSASALGVNFSRNKYYTSFSGTATGTGLDANCVITTNLANEVQYKIEMIPNNIDDIYIYKDGAWKQIQG